MSDLIKAAGSAPQRRLEHALRFVRRAWLPRTIGWVLGAICIGTTLWVRGAHLWEWAVLAGTTLAWPHLAYALAWRANDPYRAELRNLTVDSAIAGAWIALMDFSLLPSAVLAAMVSMDKVAVAGFKFLGRCSIALACACIAAALVVGVEVRLETSMEEIAGALPLLLLYPLMVSTIYYRMTRRVRDQNEILAEISRTDSLTQLLNRRYWEAAASAEFQRCRRSGRASTVLLLDIDHFKSINDQHGHPVGDQVIRSVATMLREALRQQDVPGRYGGEEFAVVLPDTNVQGATVLAERVRSLIEKSVLQAEHRVRTTVSIGIAALEAQDGGYGEWVARADRALYAAKGLGRNRTEQYNPAPS